MPEFLFEQRDDHLFFQLRLLLPGPRSTFGISLDLPLCRAFLATYHGPVPVLSPRLQISPRCRLPNHNFSSERSTKGLNNEEPSTLRQHAKARRRHQFSLCFLGILGKNLT